MPIDRRGDALRELRATVQQLGRLAWETKLKEAPDLYAEGKEAEAFSLLVSEVLDLAMQAEEYAETLEVLDLQDACRVVRVG